MAYLGVHVDDASTLAIDLRAAADLANHAQALIQAAANLADHPMPSVLLLDGVAADFEIIARNIDWAVATVSSFQLTRQGIFSSPASPQPTRTPVPAGLEPVLASPTDTSSQIAPLQWDGVPGAAWSDVHQEASHNSYAVPGGIDALVEVGVRTFELDIHRQPPATQIRSDDADIADWHVYHILGWSHREYLTLSHGLAALAAAEVAEPVTVFIDNKDGFGGTHTADAFDQLVRQALGHRLFTPGDLMLRAPGAETLLDAVQRAGWPTVAELEGRVLVVLTDDLGGYHGIGRSAFIAPPPEFSNVQGQVLHQADDNAVFYNANTRQIGIDEVQAMNVTDTVLRTYFNPRCSERFFGEAPVEVNYRAVDTALDGPTCGTQVRVRPVRVPEPG